MRTSSWFQHVNDLIYFVTFVIINDMAELVIVQK